MFAELGTAGERKVALNPNKVMRALTLYIQNFDLTSQQVQLCFQYLKDTV